MPEPKIKIRVFLTDTRTGETRTYDDDDFSEYMWSEGNWSCDCNRWLFFTNWETDEDLPCSEYGKNLIVVNKIIDLNTNEILYSESVNA